MLPARQQRAAGWRFILNELQSAIILFFLFRHEGLVLSKRSGPDKNGRTTMFLDYSALGLLFFVAIVLFYGIIAIHDIPYEIAVHRNHPQQDAIHVAGWVSLFTLHALWPLVWVWAAACSEVSVPRFSRIEDRTAINDKAEPQVGAGTADEDIT